MKERSKKTFWTHKQVCDTIEFSLMMFRDVSKMFMHSSEILRIDHKHEEIADRD